MILHSFPQNWPVMLNCHCFWQHPTICFCILQTQYLKTQIKSLHTFHSVYENAHKYAKFDPFLSSLGRLQMWFSRTGPVSETCHKCIITCWVLNHCSLQSLCLFQQYAHRKKFLNFLHKKRVVFKFFKNTDLYQKGMILGIKLEMY